jgi:hypothetical protein
LLKDRVDSERVPNISATSAVVAGTVANRIRPQIVPKSAVHPIQEQVIAKTDLPRSSLTKHLVSRTCFGR